MAQNKPQSNYSKRPTKKVRLPKIGPRKTKGLFEEYFYGFLVGIWLTLSLLLKAGGMDTSDALVMGLWVAGGTWFTWQLRKYFKEKSSPVLAKRSSLSAKAPEQADKVLLSPNLKPMIGPQWPLKTEAGAGQAAPSGGSGKKPAFVYTRPTLPDRKPKLPANWPGRREKKPKQ
jgi:hypothetical protein